MRKRIVSIFAFAIFSFISLSLFSPEYYHEADPLELARVKAEKFEAEREGTAKQREKEQKMKDRKRADAQRKRRTENIKRQKFIKQQKQQKAALKKQHATTSTTSTISSDRSAKEETVVSRGSEEDLQRLREKIRRELEEQIKKELEKQIRADEREKVSKEFQDKANRKIEQDSARQKAAQEYLKKQMEIRKEVNERMSKPDEVVRVARETFVTTFGNFRHVDFEQYKLQVMRQELERSLIGYGKIKSNDIGIINRYRKDVLESLKAIRNEWEKSNRTLTTSMQDVWLSLAGKDKARTLKSLLNEAISSLEKPVNEKKKLQVAKREGSLIKDCVDKLKIREESVRDFAEIKENELEKSYNDLQIKIAESIGKLAGKRALSPEETVLVRKELAQTVSSILKGLSEAGVNVGALGVGFRPEVVGKFKKEFGVELPSATGKVQGESIYAKRLKREKAIIIGLRKFGLDKWVPRQPSDYIKLPLKAVNGVRKNVASLIGNTVLIVAALATAGVVAIKWILSPLFEDSDEPSGLEDVDDSGLSDDDIDLDDYSDDDDLDSV